MRRHVTRRFKNRHSEQGRRAFERLDDRRMLDGSAIISYFDPLMTYLKEENQDRSCGW